MGSSYREAYYYCRDGARHVDKLYVKSRWIIPHCISGTSGIIVSKRIPRERERALCVIWKKIKSHGEITRINNSSLQTIIWKLRETREIKITYYACKILYSFTISNSKLY